MRGKLTINAATIKIIAMLTMVLDHIGYILYGHIPVEVYTMLRAVGRISFPLFAFCIAEGFFYTGNVKKYIIRVLIFALISEIPYNFFAYGSVVSIKSCNVLFTFVIALLVLWFCRYCDSIGKREYRFLRWGLLQEWHLHILLSRIIHTGEWLLWLHCIIQGLMSMPDVLYQVLFYG